MFIKYHAIETGGRCNFNCVYCRHGKQIRRETTFDEIIGMVQAVPAGENIEFTGGEIFINRDVFDIMKLAKKRFQRVKYNSNAACFFHKRFLLKAIASGMKILNVKFHSIDPGVHKVCTRTDTLPYIMKALDNLSDCVKAYDHSTEHADANKFAVIVQLAVNRTTLPTLIETVDYVSGKSFARLVLDCGTVEETDGALVGAIEKSIEIAIGNGTWPVTFGLPLCALWEYKEHVGEIYMLERRIPGYNKNQEICSVCVINTVCRGAPENQLNKFNLKPIKNHPKPQAIQDLNNIYSRLAR